MIGNFQIKEYTLNCNYSNINRKFSQTLVEKVDLILSNFPSFDERKGQ